MHWKADTGVFQQMDSIFRKQKFDFVYHLAAEYGRWNGEDHYQNLWQTNVIGTKNMLRLQEQHRFKMIFFSSAEVYGDYDQLMSEDVMDKVPLKQMKTMRFRNGLARLQCINHATMFGVKVVRVRPVGCYGPTNITVHIVGDSHFRLQRVEGKEFTVHRGHKRIFDYVEDTCRTSPTSWTISFRVRFIMSADAKTGL
jgi:dTDP-glucose 4,6-dehydratase